MPAALALPLDPAAAIPKRKPRRVLPGFGLSLGVTVTYLSLIVLIPLSAVFFKTSTMGWERFWAVVTSPRVVASYQLSFGAALLVGAIFGGVNAGLQTSPLDRGPAFYAVFLIAVPVGLLVGLLAALDAFVQSAAPGEDTISRDMNAVVWALMVAAIPLLILAWLVYQV